ncbi:MAG: hypothetical protein ACD_79C00336G0002 [uncultured bacterium]|nr:MAG: hypothetical protein ACD_79C00336G0002 [uncultured bacterium]
MFFTNFLIFILLFYTNFILRAESNTPELMFLNQLEKYYKDYGDYPIPLKTKDYFTDYTKEQKSIKNEYLLNLPKFDLTVKTLVYAKMDLNGDFPNKNAIKSYLKSQNPITPKVLLDYFRPKILNEQFKFQSGDLLFILTHNSDSYIYAYMMNSPYSHCDTLWIPPEGNPMVLMVSPIRSVVVPLSDYLLGVFSHNSRFSIYRHENFDVKKMNQILKTANDRFSNVYFDDAFHRNTNIENLDTFLKAPCFYYCAEFCYALFQYVTGNEEFSANTFVTIKQMYHNRNLKVPEIERPFIDYSENIARKENKWLIDQSFFIKSKYFHQIATYNSHKTVKDFFEGK